MFQKILDAIIRFFGGKGSSASASAQYQQLQREESRVARERIQSADGRTAEELCEVREGMSLEELDQQLKTLYKRHNRNASSLDPQKREDSAIMLEAIVEVRQRYIEDA